MVSTRELTLELPSLELERGGVVQSHRARVWVSEPAVRTAPTVLLVHALTGSARADDWWGPVIGAGRAFDPEQVRLVCFNNLGSCYGSSGPGVTGFPAEARLTTADQARAIWQGLDALGLATLALVAGGSLGGMISLQLAAQRPSSIDRALVIGATASTSAWVAGWNHVQRQLIALDEGRGFELARQLAMLTYRAEPGLERRQPALPQEDSHPVRTYLEHQGVELRQRFTVASYRALLDAMDAHDVRPALRAIDVPTLVADIDSDVLFTPAQSDALARALPHAWRATITSEHGHDAFLIEWEQVDALIRQALELPTCAVSLRHRCNQRKASSASSVGSIGVAEAGLSSSAASPAGTGRG